MKVSQYTFFIRIALSFYIKSVRPLFLLLLQRYHIKIFYLPNRVKVSSKIERTADYLFIKLISTIQSNIVSGTKSVRTVILSFQNGLHIYPVLMPIMVGFRPGPGSTARSAS